MISFKLLRRSNICVDKKYSYKKESVSQLKSEADFYLDGFLIYY